MGGLGHEGRVTYRILSADDPEWDRVICRLGVSDPYFSAGWHRAGEIAFGDGRAELFVFERVGHLLAHGSIRRRIPDASDGYDLETPYGYGGPLSNTVAPEFLTEAWSAYEGWARSTRVVAEFRRFHPILNNFVLSADSCRVHEDRKTVVISILPSEEDQILSYQPSARRNVQKALKSGLVFSEKDKECGIDVFRKYYYETMTRLYADDFYFFPEIYFSKLKSMNDVMVFQVSAGVNVAAMAIILAGGGVLHYHLGANDPSFFPLRPMNALFHGIVRWGALHGFSILHLGGGRTAADDDRLLQFKASMSRGRSIFRIGKRVYDQQTYDQLRQHWLGRLTHPKKEQTLLVWRLASEVQRGV